MGKLVGEFKKNYQLFTSKDYYCYYYLIVVIWNQKSNKLKDQQEERGISILTNFWVQHCFARLFCIYVFLQWKCSGLYTYFDMNMRKGATANMNFSRTSSTSSCKRNSTALRKFRVSKVWSAARLLDSWKFREFKN